MKWDGHISKWLSVRHHYINAVVVFVGIRRQTRQYFLCTAKQLYRNEVSELYHFWMGNYYSKLKYIFSLQFFLDKIDRFEWDTE